MYLIEYLDAIILNYGFFASKEDAFHFIDKACEGQDEYYPDRFNIIFISENTNLEPSVDHSARKNVYK